MVNQKDLSDMHGSIIEQMSAVIEKGFANQARKIQQERQADLKKLIDKLEKDGADLKKLIEDKISRLEERVSELEKKYVGLEEKNGPVEDPVTLMHQELQQLNIRKNNVVIHGLKEGELDHEQANEFMMATEPGESLDFQVLYRAGKRGPRPRTLIVKFKDEKQKKKVLDNAKNLKNKEEFKGIALAPDLTKKQREMDKQRGTEMGEEADRLNSHMTEDQKKEVKWVVVGRHEKRRLIKKPMS
jgi:hypothetical protein